MTVVDEKGRMTFLEKMVCVLLSDGAATARDVFLRLNPVITSEEEAQTVLDELTEKGIVQKKGHGYEA